MPELGSQFLEESWARRVHREIPELAKPSIFDLEDIVEGKESLEKILRQLKKYCLDFCISWDRLIKGQLEDLGADEIHTLHERQHQAHQVLVEGLNILARNCPKFSVSNSWRKKFHNREDVGRWALEAASLLKEEPKEEE